MPTLIGGTKNFWHGSLGTKLNPQHCIFILRLASSVLAKAWGWVHYPRWLTLKFFAICTLKDLSMVAFVHEWRDFLAEDFGHVSCIHHASAFEKDDDVWESACCWSFTRTQQHMFEGLLHGREIPLQFCLCHHIIQDLLPSARPFPFHENHLQVYFQGQSVPYYPWHSHLHQPEAIDPGPMILMLKEPWLVLMLRTNGPNHMIGFSWC